MWELKKKKVTDSISNFDEIRLNSFERGEDLWKDLTPRAESPSSKTDICYLIKGENQKNKKINVISVLHTL